VRQATGSATDRRVRIGGQDGLKLAIGCHLQPGCLGRSERVADHDEPVAVTAANYTQILQYNPLDYVQRSL
jgi:hypothetical protein